MDGQEWYRTELSSETQGWERSVKAWQEWISGDPNGQEMIGYERLCPERQDRSGVNPERKGNEARSKVRNGRNGNGLVKK